jgi:hypothetical protein
MSKDLTEVTHEEDREADLKVAGKILKGKRQHYQIEKRYRREDALYFGCVITSLWLQECATQRRFFCSRRRYYPA